MNRTEALINEIRRAADALERIASILAQDVAGARVLGNGHCLDTEPQSGTAEPLRPDPDIVQDPDSLIQYLLERGISVKKWREQEEGDEVLDQIALFMGERYHTLRRILELIKRAMNSGNSFTMLLGTQTPEEISNTCQLCTRLHQIAFLSEYEYQRSPRRKLLARPNRIPKALNFFSGQWLERYVKTLVISSARSRGLHIACLANPQISLPNGDDSELDMLFSIEGDVYWFEAKTGDYQQYVSRYERIASVLQLHRDRAFMVLTEVTPQTAAALSGLFNTTVVPIQDLPATVEHLLTRYEHEPDQASPLSAEPSGLAQHFTTSLEGLAR
ncbi:MAG: hypothetical protein ACUVTZ_05135 [Armatimonadota bacterium]